MDFINFYREQISFTSIVISPLIWLHTYTLIHMKPPSPKHFMNWTSLQDVKSNHNPSTTGADETLMEISSQTPQFAIAVLRSPISSPESLAITSGYVSLREYTLPTGRQWMRDEIISLSAWQLAWITDNYFKKFYFLSNKKTTWSNPLKFKSPDSIDQQTGDTFAWVLTL